MLATEVQTVTPSAPSTPSPDAAPKAATPAAPTASTSEQLDKLIAEGRARIAKGPPSEVAPKVEPDKKPDEPAKETADPAKDPAKMAESKQSDKPSDNKKLTPRERLEAKLKAEEETEKRTDEQTAEKTDEKTEDQHGELPQKRVKQFEAKIEAAKKDAVEATERAKQYEAELKTLREQASKYPPDVEKQLAELRQYRRRYGLENDPEFKSRFDSKIADAEKTVSQLTEQFPQWVKDQIKEHGSLAALANSKRTYKIKVDGEDVSVNGGGLYQELLKTMNNPLEADRLRSAIARQDELRTERERTIKEESEKADDFFKQQEEAAGLTAKQRRERQEVLDRSLKAVIADAPKNFEWLKPREVPTNDPVAAKDAQEHNENVDFLLGKLTDNLTHPAIKDALAGATDEKSLMEIGEMVVHATEKFALEADLLSKDTEIKRLHKQIENLKSKDRTTAPGSTVGARATTTTATTGFKPGTSLSQMIEAGRRTGAIPSA